MSIWLKRVGATYGPYDLPHQAKDAIRMMVWVDNPVNLFQRINGHLLLPTEPNVWAPTLSLETAHPGPLLPVTLETESSHYRRVWGAAQRPYSFRVDVPSGVGNCFKIIETSYPMHKHSVCLPPAAMDPTCSVLAPTSVYTAAAPALYSALGPIRHAQSTRDWAGFYDQVSRRIINYVTYHVAMGMSGLLLYADMLMRRFLSRNAELVELVRQGHLRLVEWELQERAHNDTDGVGRPLGYNYDQGLTASHALLGLSSCGANVLMLNADLDEFIYFNEAGRKWPVPWGSCMAPGAGASVAPQAQPPLVSVVRLPRFETLTTSVTAEEEEALWIRTGTLETRFDESGGGGGDAAARFTTNPPGATPHPLSRYDVVYGKPLPINQVKQVSMPAAWVVLFWVHEGTPLHGETRFLDFHCSAIMHVSNAYRPRRWVAQQRPLPEELRRFRHWMFVREGTANESLWRL